MKAIVVSMALVLGSSFAMAQEGHTAPPAAAPAAEAPAMKKMSKKEAKTACKSEGKKGKDLKECIKEKTM